MAILQVVVLIAALVGVSSATECYQCGGASPQSSCSATASSGDDKTMCSGKCYGILTMAGDAELIQRGCQEGQCVDADTTTSGQRSIQKCCEGDLCNTKVDSPVSSATECYQCGGAPPQTSCSATASSGDDKTTCSGKCYGILTLIGNAELRQRGCEDGQCVDADTTTNGQRSIQKCCEGDLCNTKEEKPAEGPNGAPALQQNATFPIMGAMLLYIVSSIIS